jgi:hypothetical protein
MYEAKILASDLLHTIQRLQHNNVKHKGDHGEALQALAKIFKMKTNDLDTTHQEPIQTSTNPTDPDNIQTAP